MSHVAAVRLVIHDLDVFKAVCEQFGIKVDYDNLRWRWYGRWMRDYDEQDAAFHHGIKPEDYGKADHAVLTVPGCHYQIGMYRNRGKDEDGNDVGGFVLVFDNWANAPGGLIEGVLGKGLREFNQEYSARVTEKTMKRKGYRTRRIVKDGQLKLELQ